MDNKYVECTSCGTKFYACRGESVCDSCQKVKTSAAIAQHEMVKAKADREAAEHSLRAMEIKKNLVVEKARRNWRVYGLIWFTCWTIAGGVFALYERYSGDGKGCVYRSVSSVINPGFVLGCELLRERWEIGK